MIRKILLLSTIVLTTFSTIAADVQISRLTDTPDPATRGGEITYAISLLNGNNDTANDVTLTIPLPATTSFVSIDDGNCVHDGGTPGTVNCNFGDITGDGVGAPVTDVNLVITTGGASGNTISLTATVGTSSPDGNAANDSLTQNTTIDDGADLNIVQSDSADPIIAGGTYSYSIDVNNIGPNDSNAIIVTDTLPTNVSYISSSGAGWTCGDSGQVVTCTRATIANGANAPTITINAQVTGAVTGAITNTVNVTATTGDPSLSNNTATENTLVNQGTELTLDKSVAEPVVGLATTSFTLSPRNLGPYNADTVSITDTLPAGFTYISASGSGWVCNNVGQDVTCNRATYAIGATDDIVIQTNVPASGNNITNSATISSATPDPNVGNDTGSVTFSIVPDGADLSITKVKTPDPVAQGADMTSRIRVSNTGPKATSGTITVTDTLSVNETYSSFSGSNWACIHGGGVVTCEYGLSIANGANSSYLDIVTVATNNGTISNTACVSDVAGEVDAIGGNDCASASAQSTTTIADLAITKTVSTAGGVNDVLEVNENTITYVLTVSNSGDDIIDIGNANVDNGVVIDDTVPGFVSGDTVVNATVTGGTQQNFTCSVTNANVQCILDDGQTFGGSNDGGGDDNVEITITTQRGLFDGVFTNTANVSSAILGENTIANNSSSVGITVNPVADVEMQSLVITPANSQAGTESTYVLTFINNGPSSAADVNVDHVFTPPGGRSYQLISSTASQGSCLALAGNTLTCNIGTLARNQTETITLKVQPGWDGANSAWILGNNASITTTTTESDGANNSQSENLNVAKAELDLLVNNTDVSDPVGWTPTPGAFPGSLDNIIVYQLDMTNRGPSLATGVTLTDVMSPAAGKQVTFLCDDAGSASCLIGTSLCNNLGTSATGNATITTSCTLPDIVANTTLTRYLYFRADTAPDSTGDTHNNVATISSNEDDIIPSNDNESETTSVRVMVDLAVTKNPSQASVSINEPFNWNIVISNDGPGDSANSNLADNLPAGMELTATPVPSQGSCTGVAGDNSFTCSLNTINNGANATVTVPVRVTVPAAGGTTSNTTSVTTFGVDTDGANDSDTGTVTVTTSSIAGTVFNDQNDDGLINASEHGLANVIITLSGTDNWGNAINEVILTDADGNYLIDDLPASTNYTITETQPANFTDGLESQDGVLVSNSRATDVITTFTLPANTDLVNYNFSELGQASFQGSVWHDLNNDGVKGAGETTGISNVTITLTGTETVSGKAVTFTTTTNSDGGYAFNNIVAGTYTLTETQPVTWADGTDQLGSAGGVLGNDNFSGIALGANESATNYNFGEQGASLSGYVYRDVNDNGVQDGGEQGLAGVTIMLSGIDGSAMAINETITTDNNGFYQFIGLPASDGAGYTLSETQPSLIFDGQDSAGNLGGTVSNDVISAIILPANTQGINYNFGEGKDIVSSISGFVFIDDNNNGIQDLGELGLANVELTLTGKNSQGNAVNETQFTDGNGQYIFVDLIASNADGYTITQTQPQNYNDGLDSKLGQVIADSRDTDIIEGVVLVDDENLTDNNFAELYQGSISGTVFVDRNDDGTQQSGETGLAGVLITITGNTISGEPINLTTITDSNGFYQFDNLNESDVAGYTITQTQPQDYNDGLDSKLGSVLPDSRGTDAITGIVIDGATNAENIDFAELYKASLAGTVFIDNNNGLLEADEVGIANVVLQLSGFDQDNNPVNRSVTTNSLGQYIFEQLPPSDVNGYTLTEIHPSEYLDGLESINTSVLPDTNQTDVFNNIDVLLTSELSNYNFAELQKASISGFVYQDKNDDGIKSQEELGIENVVLTLTGFDQNGEPVDVTVTTDENGFYHFTDLLPSDENGYQIIQTQPVDYIDGLESIENVAIDDSRSTDVISPIVLTANQHLENYNFAELDTASISGSVWVDENDNGIIDEDEALRIANVTIVLTGFESNLSGETPQEITKTILTDEYGQYSFTELKAGQYSLSQQQPNAWMDGKDQLGSLDGELSNDLIDSIALEAGQQGINYNFGEQGSRLQGWVFNDLNDNALKELNEAGIPKVEIQLTGIDSNGQVVSRITNTVVDGQYFFEHLPLSDANGYQVTEIQPENVDDGQDSVGSIGGALANDKISNIVFTEHFTDAVEYNFGELIREPASISGMVWLDSNHNREEDDGNGLGGWIVELIDSRVDAKNNLDITLIARVITDSDGKYLFDGLSPGEYEIRFIHPQGGVIYGYPVSDEQGVDLTAGTIRKLVLEESEHIDNQNLPIDPSGVVYDSKTREAVAGASVTIVGPPGFDPDRDLIGGLNNVSQITSDDGIYQFLLFNSAPTGVYLLDIIEPAGYLPGVSTRIKACTNTPDVLSNPNPALVQAQDTPPDVNAILHDENSCGASSGEFSAGEFSTQYYLSFNIDPQLPSGNVINNHIPVDPIDDELFSVVKTTSTQNASRGDLVPYSIVVKNNAQITLQDMTVIDQLPPGFKYVQGSATMDGQKLEPTINGRQLSWYNIDFDAEAQHQFNLMTVIGAGVGEGEYANQAWVIDNGSNTTVANVASATVRIVPDPLFDCSDIIGKVFNDKNANGYQDEGELGLPAVRLATAQGLLVTTDKNGRYHIACAEVPNEMRGSNFVIKVDERTLPSGFRITSENPRVVRLTRGKLAKADFGATIHRVVRIQLNALAFDNNSLKKEHLNSLNKALRSLRLKPSILRVAYQQGIEDDNTVDERLEKLIEYIEQQWQLCDCQYELNIEQEITLKGDDLEQLGQTRRAGNE